MDAANPARFADVFAPVEVLAPATRRRLAELVVAPPGRAPVLFAADLADAPLPAAVDARRRLGATVAGGLTAGVLARLAAVPIGDVVPTLASVAAPVGARPLPPRAGRHLAERDMTAWSAVADLTVGDIAAWPAVGRSKVAALIGTAVDVAVEHAGNQSAVVAPDAHGVLSLLDRVLDQVGDDRDRAVFAHLVLGVGPGFTPGLAEVGAELGVVAERVRQLRARGCDRAAAAALASPPALGSLVATIGARLGAAAPVKAVDAVLVALGLPARPDVRSLLALWLAGPHRRVPGHDAWLSTDPGGLLDETRGALAEDGGVRDADQVAKELARWGLVDSHATAWVADQAVLVVDGLLVSTAGHPAEVAERVLFATGRPLPAAALASAVDIDLAVLVAAVGRDRRFRRSPDGEVGLVEWSDDPVTTSYDAGPVGPIEEERTE